MQSTSDQHLCGLLCNLDENNSYVDCYTSTPDQHLCRLQFKVHPINTSVDCYAKYIGSTPLSISIQSTSDQHLCRLLYIVHQINTSVDRYTDYIRTTPMLIARLLYKVHPNNTLSIAIQRTSEQHLCRSIYEENPINTSVDRYTKYEHPINTSLNPYAKYIRSTPLSIAMQCTSDQHLCRSLCKVHQIYTSVDRYTKYIRSTPMSIAIRSTVETELNAHGLLYDVFLSF